MRIILDAMGGDNAPQAPVLGALQAAKDFGAQITLVGKGEEILKVLKEQGISDLPEGMSRNDFRDPKILREPDGTYRFVVGTRIPDKEGAILLFSSPDGFAWKYESILIQNDGSFGLMWEGPDFFELQGKHVLLCSPQDMLPEGFEYHNGNGTLCLIGELDEERKAAMVSNLLVVLCGNKDAQPIVNSGSLY